jgi:hypothetical protein
MKSRGILARRGDRVTRVSASPPVSVAALQRLPGSSARSFAIGVALGRWIDAEGSSSRLVGKTAAGSLIDHKRLPNVLEAIGITARTWREYAAEWEENYLATAAAGRPSAFSLVLYRTAGRHRASGSTTTTSRSWRTCLEGLASQAAFSAPSRRRHQRRFAVQTAPFRKGRTVQTTPFLGTVLQHPGRGVSTVRK